MKSSSLGRPSQMAKTAYFHRKKSQKKPNKSFTYNIQQFRFDLPNYSMPITVRAVQTSPPQEFPRVKATIHMDDCRKEQIKQKIKFRVKQEMWAFMKKDLQKPMMAQTCFIPDFKKEFNPQAPKVYVKGSSFTRLSRESTTFRKNSELLESKNLSKSYYKNTSQEYQGDINQPKKHKRVWSSFVKMKDKDRLELQRTEHRASVSVANIEKLDAYKIQPWKGFEDSENLLDQR